MTILWKTYLRDKWHAFKKGESIWTWVLIGMGTTIAFPFLPFDRFNPFNLIIGALWGIFIKIFTDMVKWDIERFREEYVE